MILHQSLRIWQTPWYNLLKKRHLYNIAEIAKTFYYNSFWCNHRIRELINEIMTFLSFFWQNFWLSDLMVPEIPLPHQILADKLTLFQPWEGGRLCPTHYYLVPPDFQTFLWPWNFWQEQPIFSPSFLVPFTARKISTIASQTKQFLM